MLLPPLKGDVMLMRDCALPLPLLPLPLLRMLARFLPALVPYRPIVEYVDVYEEGDVDENEDVESGRGP